jgi:uridylate kinase
MEVINRDLKVMDLTALTHCMENNMPIVAFGLNSEDGLLKAARGEKIGTLIK